MTLLLSVILMLASSVLMLPALSNASTNILGAALIGMAISGTHISLVMGLRKYIYTATSLFFHVVLCVFVGYVYLIRGSVLPTPSFDFSVFTEDNLQTALGALSLVVMATLLVWLLVARSSANMLRTSAKQSIVELIGRLHLLGDRWAVALMLCSFGLAVLLFATNTTVLDLPYPDNRFAQWIPGELLKIPTFLATLVVLVSYARFLHFDSRLSRLLLNFARINIVVTLVLMLTIEGSRGLFTFIWLFLGLLELYLLLKRRSSIAWAIVFLGLAWTAYYLWPFLRVTLSDQAANASLLLLIGELSMDVTSPSEGEQLLYLEEFPLIGQSLFHLLYVIQLINDGVSLRGQTFLNLAPQVLPEFLDGVLWDRPLNDNWRLADHFYHGGGFLTVANAYWNGGLAVMTSFVIALTAIFAGFDRYLVGRRTGVLYKTIYWLWLPVMVVQLGYGVQGLARVVELLALVIVIDQINWRAPLTRSRAPV